MNSWCPEWRYLQPAHSSQRCSDPWCKSWPEWVRWWSWRPALSLILWRYWSGNCSWSTPSRSQSYTGSLLTNTIGTYYPQICYGDCQRDQDRYVARVMVWILEGRQSIDYNETQTHHDDGGEDREHFAPEFLAKWETEVTPVDVFRLGRHFYLNVLAYQIALLDWKVAIFFPTLHKALQFMERTVLVTR